MSKRAEDRTYHFTYKVTCINTKRIFYGIHSTDSLEDGFIGAGSALYESKKDHGADAHIFERLCLFKTRKAAKIEFENLKSTQLLNPKRPSEYTFHYVYKIIRKFDGAFYIGIHSTNNLNDQYLGSGIYITYSKKKYGAAAHYREILEMCPSREAAFEREKEIVALYLKKDPLCMNLIEGGIGSAERVYGFTIETREKKSIKAKNYWEKKKKLYPSRIDTTPITLTREQVLDLLITSSGQLNKNATRNIVKALDLTEMPLTVRELNVVKKWQAVYRAIDDFRFSNLVEKINAYVYQITEKPVCKMCSKHTTFFRFGQPYAIYCGASCQLRDPANKNPVLCRWASRK